MELLCRKTAFAAVGILIASFVAGCGESKIDQCNKLIEEINKLDPLAGEFETKSDGIGKTLESVKDFDEFKKKAIELSNTFNGITSKWDSINQEIKKIELADEKLVSFQKKYTTNSNEVMKGIQWMSQAFKDISKIEVTGDFEKNSKRLNRIWIAYQKRVMMRRQRWIKLLQKSIAIVVQNSRDSEEKSAIKM